MPGSETFNLPAAPPELCFDKDEFVKKSFSVDEFLHQHRHAAGLESMRDDLGIYLKVLRSAMIELINEDYADFVNLSSNLVGLDQSIGGIQTPLGQLREEIVTVKATLTDTMAELQQCLDDKRAFRAQLKSAQSVAKVEVAIEKMEVLLKPDDVDETLLERCALEYVQIGFDLQFCQAVENDSCSKLRPGKIHELHRTLIDRIERYFLSVVREQNVERLERCLRIFCTLDECGVAEEIFRKEVVAKHMHPIISESALQNSPQGLEGIYNQVLSFIDKQMIPLMTLTRMRNESGEIMACRVKGFDFILNSFWAEVEHRLETHMSSIFAPGNPDQFYQKYQHTIIFLRRLEEIIGTAEGVKRFNEHEKYKSFQTRWNLPVYFQIRFQEIGGALENALSRSFDANLLQSTDDGRPSFIPIHTAINCIEKCWSDGIYLSQIFVRFWKLTLQILSRTSKWIDEFSELTSWSGSEKSLIDVFVLLYIDIVQLGDTLPGFLTTINGQLDDHMSEHVNLLKTCFDDSNQALKQRLQTILKRLVKEVVNKSLPNIKQVSDIPRLFRKTNRDIPSKASAYVDQILEAAVQFFNKYQTQMDVAVVRLVLVDIFSALNEKYFAAVDDVLTSVQKTEESLRRLKNLREKTASTLTPDAGSMATAEQRTTMSDDDKIRLQLQVDVVHWSTSIEKMGVMTQQVQRLEELIALVELSSPLRGLKK